ncbi:MAG: hypothetical protein WCG78_07860, partial [Candidatus Omnitrophota bacterium]
HMVVLGGVYEHHPVLQEAFKGALAEHLGEQQGRLTLFTVDDAANVGAGVIGAIAEQGRPAAMPVPLLPASAAPAAMAI